MDPVEDELKKISRRLDSLQNTVDLLYQDRNMLEDIVSRVSQLEHALNINREHQTDTARHLENQIKKVEIAVEDKVDEVRMGVEDKTIILRSATENIFSKIKAKFGVKLK